MFKLMISDDSPYILQDLSESIDWEDFDFDLIGAYQDGRELLDAAKNAAPDLVITDISMPQMDGMQLSAHLYQLNPEIKIIFISEHSEFEYAKKALNLHIFDYLVKPIQQEQLTDVMGKVLHRLQKEQRQQFEQLAALSQQDYYRKTALSHYASRLLFHADNELQIREEFVRLGLQLPDFFHLYVVCYTLNHRLNSQNPENSYSYFQSLLADDLVESQIIPMTLENHHGIFLLIVHDRNISVPDQLARLCVDVESQMKLCITMGYSDYSTNFSDLPQLYEQAQTAIRHLKEAAISVPIISYKDIHAETDNEIPADDNKVPTGNSYSKNIKAMRTFIEKNYMEPITTNDVAHSVYLSPSYANLCFNNECGITIFGYIAQYRMEKAKDFLKNTDEQVTRIAELVGYSGKTSFYLAFRRYTGISPTEYRMQCIDS